MSDCFVNSVRIILIRSHYCFGHSLNHLIQRLTELELIPMNRDSSVKCSRVLAVDYYPVYYDALKIHLSQTEDVDIIGHATTIVEAMRTIESTMPNAVVVDLLLGDESGLDLLERIRKRYPGVACIVWTAHHGLHYADRALRAGARAFVTKNESISTVYMAIRTAVTGQIFLNDTLSQMLLQRMAYNGVRQSDFDPKVLSNRELEVFRLIGDGRKTRDIANVMHVSMNTVQAFRDRIRKKLNLSNTTELVHFATTRRSQSMGQILKIN